MIMAEANQGNNIASSNNAMKIIMPNTQSTIFFSQKNLGLNTHPPKYLFSKL